MQSNWDFSELSNKQYLWKNMWSFQVRMNSLIFFRQNEFFIIYIIKKILYFNSIAGANRYKRWKKHDMSIHILFY